MTKQKFFAYERVRESGLTNMFDVNEVILLAKSYSQKLTKQDCFEIMLNYPKYKKKYEDN